MAASLPAGGVARVNDGGTADPHGSSTSTQGRPGVDGGDILSPMTTANGAHADEPHRQGLSQRLNWLRAGVLGANDGIVSTAAVVVGVAGATSDTGPVLIAGLAALVGGAISMALGEYVSVSSQRDSEHALIQKEKRELADDPEAELAELVGMYEAQGLSRDTATRVATELTASDALKAHLAVELNIDADDVVSPWAAALASAVAFTIGALLPLATILFAPVEIRVPLTFVAVLIALAITGYVAAYIGGARRGRAVLRTVIGGALALAATYAVGALFGCPQGNRPLYHLLGRPGNLSRRRRRRLTKESRMDTTPAPALDASPVSTCRQMSAPRSSMPCAISPRPSSPPTPSSGMPRSISLATCCAARGSWVSAASTSTTTSAAPGCHERMRWRSSRSSPTATPR